MQMRNISLKRSVVGMTVAESLYDKWGRCIIKKGNTLRRAHVFALQRSGYEEVPITFCTNLTLDLMTCVDMISKESMSKSEYVYNKLKSSVKTIVSDILDKESLFDVFNLRHYDAYTCVHSIDVATISLLLGIGYGLTESYLNDLYISALLHDIGKMAIPEEIIKKPSGLTDDEFDIIRKHPVEGVNMLAATPLYTMPICDGILYHHENVDGSGYPMKLKGDNIPLFARIIHIADVYDALTTDRPYRDKSTLLYAYNYILDNVNTMFDPDLVDIFKKRVQPLRKGAVVQLSNDSIGIVTEENKESVDKPIVFDISSKSLVDLSLSYIHVKEQVSL